MRYFKYFQQGQKVLMRAISPEPPIERFEALTAYVQECGIGYLDLTLPYRLPNDEEYPFAPGMPFEFLSTGLGLGLRMTGRFRNQQNAERIRMSINPDLHIFQRRIHRRLDIHVGLRYAKGTGKLRSLRSQWEQNVALLNDRQDLKLPSLPAGPVNLSASGIRFPLAPPVAVADLAMLLLRLDETQPPICALAEVVWTGHPLSDGRIPAGMQFIEILEADRLRIERYVRQAERAKSKAPAAV
jgi:c-di-GMP-binding flagellar brake protein YcgR